MLFGLFYENETLTGNVCEEQNSPTDPSLCQNAIKQRFGYAKRPLVAAIAYYTFNV